MRITLLLPFLLLLGTQEMLAQTTPDSTVLEIAPVDITSYFSSQPILGLTSSAKVLSKRLIESQQPHSFLPAMNTTPGVRMEERSPGSYRIAMRGSMLRSPFGVRNTKIYIDEIPFTDAGGNTYFNLLDPVGVHRISILKGPDGSLFGPNSGGVIRVAPNGFDDRLNEASVLLSGGSFGTFHQQLHLHQNVSDRYQFAFDQAYMRSDGFRENTALDKKYFQTAHRWQYNEKGSLRLFALYSDLFYHTPGGLTEAQFLENPRQARPVTPATPVSPELPSAVEQQASIRNRTGLGGLTHRYDFSENWRHSVTVFGTLTDFTNPFISNYEKRDERNYGVRSFVSYTNETQADLRWQMQLGLEAQGGRYQIDNYANHGGERGDPQEFDLLRNGQHFYFYRARATLWDKLNIEGSIGLNFNSISFEQQFPVVDNNTGRIDFDNTWMPRIAASYMLHPQVAWRASVSKGYSPPTIAEVRPSDNQINADLLAESGTNYETGVRAETANRRLIADVSVYSYRLRNGIVRQLNEIGAESFFNAGEIQQTGVEMMLLGQAIVPNDHAFVRALNLSTNLTFQDYTFNRYETVANNAPVDYSGNKVTSIPDWIVVSTAMMEFPHQIGLNLLHNYTSDIPLNDANTAFANEYHLIQAKVHWTKRLNNRWNIQLFFGVDNLLDEVYSLGNDINDRGGRFYNMAPSRNYYGGMKLML